MYSNNLNIMAKEIEIIEVHADMLDDMSEFAFRHQNAPYYLAHETDITVPISTLQKDLKWLRKHFGTELMKNGKFDESSPITKDSLNSGRRNEIANLQLCLDLGVPMWELDNYDKENKCWKIIVDIYSGEETEYSPARLTNRKGFEDNIKKGLLVLCKIVTI